MPTGLLGERGTFSPAGNCTIAVLQSRRCELRQHRKGSVRPSLRRRSVGDPWPVRLMTLLSYTAPKGPGPGACHGAEGRRSRRRRLVRDRGSWLARPVGRGGRRTASQRRRRWLAAVGRAPGPVSDYSVDAKMGTALESQDGQPGLVPVKAVYPHEPESVGILKIVLDGADGRASAAPAERHYEPVPRRGTDVPAGIQVAAALEAAHGRGGGPPVHAIRPDAESLVLQQVLDCDDPFADVARPDVGPPKGRLPGRMRRRRRPGSGARWRGGDKRRPGSHGYQAEHPENARRTNDLIEPPVALLSPAARVAACVTCESWPSAN